MTPEEYAQLARWFTEACDLPPERRAEFTDGVGRAAPQLRGPLEAMLARDGTSAWLSGTAEPDSQATMSLLPPEGVCERLPEQRSLAGYELLGEIGRGGMGVVYKARQRQPNRIVAIKMIRAQQFASPAEVQRFYTEAEAAANLDHDGVVPIYEVGAQDGQPYFSMKYIEGESLGQRLGRGGVDREQAVRWLQRVSEAVGHAHARGIVHRDLKPSNILLDGSGQPRVTDFGLAKYLDRDSTLTNAGAIMGTPGYMAPEQARGESESVTAAADVYSLGAILYQILTGRPPIQADRVNLAGTLRRIEEHDVVPPRALDRRIDRELNTICMKCLEKDPAARYATAGELAKDLTRFLDGDPIAARAPGPGRQLLRWARQRPGQAATWAAVALFYGYHCLSYYVLKSPDLTPEFHRIGSLIAAAWVLAAWGFQRRLLTSAHRVRWLYAWVTTDVLLLTLLLLAADGAKSAMAPVYLVLVAGAVLRFRVRLIGYVTALCVVGYLTQVLQAWLVRPALLPGWRQAVPFVLSLVVIGIVQYFALRRSQAVEPRNGP